MADLEVRYRERAEGTAERVFLIADVRGYTRFTREHGDEAAARLAQSFAWLARDSVEARAGRVIELRGDEALAVFSSPAAAVRAGSELVEACAEASAADPDIPLHVGVGIDVGEAVPVEGGFRGAALPRRPLAPRRGRLERATAARLHGDLAPRPDAPVAP